MFNCCNNVSLKNRKGDITSWSKWAQSVLALSHESTAMVRPGTAENITHTSVPKRSLVSQRLRILLFSSSWIPQYQGSLIASPAVKIFGFWGLALPVPSLCHLSPSAAALGNQTVSPGCAASCSEGGTHPSFHGICDPFGGRLFLAGSFALQKFTYLKGEGVWESMWNSHGKQKISSPSWHLPKASLSLVQDLKPVFCSLVRRCKDR